MTCRHLYIFALGVALVSASAGCKTTSSDTASNTEPVSEETASAEAAPAESNTPEPSDDGAPSPANAPEEEASPAPADTAEARGEQVPAEDQADKDEADEAVENSKGKPVVTGALDKDQIRAVIEKHRNKIRFCYEKQLLEQADLAGQVTMNFTIDASGGVIVAKVKNSSLNNTAVESCMARVIETWTFPEPRGGGTVIVNYPFSFSPN